MRLSAIVVAIVLTGALIGFVRSHADGFPLTHAFPLIGGRSPSLLWDGAALLMIVIAVGAIRRVMTR